MDMFSIAAGGAGVGLLWFLKLAGGKVLPVALAWIRAKWGGAGKPDLKSLQADIVAAHGKVDSLRSGLSANFASVYAEIDEIKAKLGLPIATAAQPAPASPIAPAILEGQS